ncbi:MAG: peptidylprolyl isomerase [Clostridia bacterium]|nr:peptidylprolyl isomerase [Clostridia bacterium]
MENNNKSQAELYREERKERLAKAAAKNAKKSPMSVKTQKTVKKVISIVLAVVIAFGAVAGVLNFFDIPQKTVKVSIDGVKEKISLAEINYFYFQTWMQSFNTAAQYEQYGEGMGLSMTGFDYTKAPDQQEYTEEQVQFTGVAMEDLGDIKEPTWQDVFTYSAVYQLVNAKYGAEKAREAGLKLTEAEEKEIDSQFEEMRKTAKENDYSLNRWLRLQLGYGVTEKLIRNITEEMYLAQKYYDKVTEDTTNAVTADKINEEYKANKDDYDVVDLRIYAFAADLGSNHTHEEGEDHEKEHAEAEAKAKKNAEAFLEKATDEEKFIAAAKSDILSKDNKSTKDPDASTLVENTKYATLTSSYSEAVAKWVYDDARKAGEIAVVDGENGTFYVVMMKTLPHKDTSIYSSDVRHILIKFPDKNTDGTATSTKDEDGNSVTNITEATKKATKEKAQAVLDEYLKNPTEDNFIELTKKHSEDVDSSGNPNYGGLYEGVMNDGTYVKPFTNWSIAEGRKAGDTEIIESDFGYHIMYFVKAGNLSWYQAVQTALVGAEIEEGIAKEIEDCVHSVKLDSFTINWTLKRENKHISTIIVNNLGASHAGHNH